MAGIGIDPAFRRGRPRRLVEELGCDLFIGRRIGRTKARLQGRITVHGRSLNVRRHGSSTFVRELASIQPCSLRHHVLYLPMSAAHAGRAVGAGAVDTQGVRQLMGFLAPFVRFFTALTAARHHGRMRSARLLAAALAAVMASPAVAQTGIKFTLDGPIEGPEALFLVPHDRGYFKTEGLEVVVDDAVSPLDPILRVASGGY